MAEFRCILTARFEGAVTRGLWDCGRGGGPYGQSVPNTRTQQREERTRVEAGSNTSTVTLRVVEGDEKGSLESETVKYGHESYVTRTRK
jgi:hypothetical protein